MPWCIPGGQVVIAQPLDQCVDKSSILSGPVANQLWLLTTLQAPTKRSPKQAAKVVVAAFVSVYQF